MSNTDNKYYRFVCNDYGIYETVNRYCLPDDPRRENKPDGSWLPKVGTDYPGAISFWTEFGLQTYYDSRLMHWHCSVVPDEVVVLLADTLQEPLYTDEYQIICDPEAITLNLKLPLTEFLKTKFA